jgi:hypothetical protein
MRSERNHRLIQQAIDDGLSYTEGHLVSKYGTRIKPYRNNNGYLIVNLTVRGQKIAVPIARAICWIAHGPPPSIFYDTDHIDQNKLNNSPENLRWLTHKDNLANHSNLAQWKAAMLHIGEAHHSAKLTDSSVRELRQLYDSGWKIPELAKRFGIGETTAFCAAKRESWTHIT